MTSGYFPYNAREVQNYLVWTTANKLSMVFGCDINIHQLCWENSKTNHQGMYCILWAIDRDQRQ